MSKFAEWLQEQAVIYQTKFEGVRQVVREQGLRPDPVMPRRRGGPFVHFRHPPGLTSRLAELSRQINSFVNAVIFDEGNLHTTLAVSNRDNFVYNTVLDPVLKEIAAAVADGLRKVGSAAIEEMSIEYLQVLYNQTTAIAAGIPNSAYFDVISAVLADCQKVLSTFEEPWGCHITLSRFLETTSGKQGCELANFLDDVDKLGVIHPASLGVGYCLGQGATFLLNTKYHFPLET